MICEKKKFGFYIFKKSDGVDLILRKNKKIGNIKKKIISLIIYNNIKYLIIKFFNINII